VVRDLGEICDVLFCLVSEEVRRKGWFPRLPHVFDSISPDLL
jgi:hypothetical protein